MLTVSPAPKKLADPELETRLRNLGARRKQTKRVYDEANADLKAVILEARAAGVSRPVITALTGIAGSIIQNWDAAAQHD